MSSAEIFTQHAKLKCYGKYSNHFLMFLRLFGMIPFLPDETNGIDRCFQLIMKQVHFIYHLACWVKNSADDIL